MKTLTRRTAPGAIARREEFNASALSARYVTSTAPVGILPYEHRADFRAAFPADGTPTYVVYSYATPIAWEVDGELVIPEVRYSATTSRHQSLVRHSHYPALCH